MTGPIFILKNVSKKFRTGTKDFYALKNINLEINSGLVCVTGKSGSGKSTFLNLLSGIEKASSGSIFYLNKNISKYSDSRFSKYHLNDISLVFQHYNLFNDFNAFENVIIPLEMKGIKKKESAEKVDNLFRKFQLDYLKDKKVKLLSGGEKQRIAIMRALITEPKVLLCDEPTGALDIKNSEQIMDILKSISKERLVVVVSHNLELVNKYADRIIAFKDGEIINDRIINETSIENICSNNKYTYSSQWINRFLKLNLRRNSKKIILAFITFIIGFVSIFLSVGFSSGAKESQKNALDTNLAITYSTVSETTYLKIDNSPLSFEKKVRPSVNLIDEKLGDFSSVIYAQNLSYFFSNYPIGKYENKNIDGFEMIPIYEISKNDFKADLLLSGTLPSESIDEVLVNKEFVELIGCSYDKIADELFNISYSIDFSIPSGDKDNPLIKDTFSYNFNLRIAGVINEFSFLNTPKIYYSYLAAKQFLSEKYSKEISLNKGKNYSYFDLINDCENDNIFSSYSSILFLNSLNEKDKYFDLIKELSDSKDNLKITSTAYDIQTSYSSFIDSFSSALYVFVIIAFVGINFIIGMISLSNFIQNKKETAILTCLGARNKSIVSIYLTENICVLFITLLLACCLSFFAQDLLNKLIYKQFSLSNLLNIPFSMFYNVKFGLPIFIFLLSIISISIFTLVPLFMYRKISLSDELRDE